MTGCEKLLFVFFDGRCEGKTCHTHGNAHLVKYLYWKKYQNNYCIDCYNDRLHYIFSVHKVESVCT